MVKIIGFVLATLLLPGVGYATKPQKTEVEVSEQCVATPIAYESSIENALEETIESLEVEAVTVETEKKNKEIRLPLDEKNEEKVNYFHKLRLVVSNLTPGLFCF